MSKYARLNGSGVVLEVFSGIDSLTGNLVAPSQVFPPSLAVQFVPCPDNTIASATYAGGVWTNPPAPAAVAAKLPPLEPMQFYLAFTPLERVAIKKSTDAVVQEFWDTYQRAERTNTPIDPNSPAVQGGLAYLAQPTTTTPPGPGILAAGRVAQILAGTPQ